MHARELVEAAALLCLRSRTLIDQSTPLDQDALSEYWIASRCRLDHWGRLLRSLGNSHSAPASEEDGDLLARLSDEVSVSEVLSRAVAAICLAHDKQHGLDEAAPITRNALDAHRESRERLRKLRHAWWPSDSPKTGLARSLERQSARWTDVLLAYLGHAPEVEPLAFDSTRLREFAYDSHTHGQASSEGALQLLLFSLRSSFSAATSMPVCGDLNRRIAGAAIGLFGPDAFDSLGMMRPTWMLRAERTTEETIALVDHLFTDDAPDRGFEVPHRWWI